MNINPLNLITAFTNITAFFPLYRSCVHKDFITFGAISFVAVFSFISHLYENHKHGMGLKEHSKVVSYYLSKLDVLGAWIVVFRLLPMAFAVYDRVGITYYVFAGITGFFGAISEYDITEETRTKYLIFHGLWHLGSFVAIDQLLGTYYSYIDHAV